MSTLRILESVVLPGKNGQWRAGAKEVKSIIEAEGGNISFYQLTAGGNPATVFGVSTFADMDSFSAFGDKMNSSTKLPEWMQGQAQLEGFPFSEPVNVNIMRDIHDEVGEPSGLVENPQILVVFRQMLNPGKRPAFISMVKAIREAMKSEGKSVGNSMECVIGEVGMVTRGMAFANMADWAVAQQAGFSENVQKILQDSQADGPIFQSIESRMLRNITDTL